MKLLPRHRTRPEQTSPISARSINRNLLVSNDGTWAWFELSPVQWAYQSGSERNALLNVATLRWADLAGHRVHLRMTQQPVPYNVWAEQLDRRSPKRIPDVPGTETWDDFLAASQRRIIAARLEDPTTYIGVRLTPRPLKDDQLVRILDERQVDLPAELSKVRKTLRRVTEAIRKDGFRGEPVSARGLGWLMHASVGLGAPVSANALAAGTDTWTEGDLDAFTAPVRVTAEPFGKTVRVQAMRDGREHTHRAAILTASRFGARDTDNPSLAPWLSYAQRLPFPVEFSAILDVLPGVEMRSRTSYDRRRAENIHEHHEEHNERPPAMVGRAIDDASRIEDEVHDGTREVATRVAGPIRVAIFGRDEDDALSNVAEFIDAYAADQSVEWTHVYAQHAHAMEFIPGQAASQHRGHVRVMPALFAATAVPNASTGIGDGEGPYLGQVIGGGRRAVMFDPTWGPRHNVSGMGIFTGGLGSGKSTAAGAMLDPAVRRGWQCVLNDPSGGMGAVALLPYLRGKVRHIELSGSEPGTLNPYLLVPEPRRQDFPHEQAWRAAQREASAERVDLTYDTLVKLLAPQVISREPGIIDAIEDAVNSVGGSYGTNPWQIIGHLQRSGGVGKVAADRLRAAAGMKGGSLIFPESEVDDAVLDGFDDALLTILTMRGVMTPPADVDRADWTRPERMAVPVLHLASRFAQRLMYANRDPKVIITDEGGIIAAGASSFRSFLLRGSRDSRKHNTFFGLLTQNPADVTGISAQINNLTGMAMCGRTTDAEAAEASLKLLGVPAGYGYEQVLTRLEPGQFLMRDYLGRVEKVQVDLEHRPDLKVALNTTPDDLDVMPHIERESVFA